MGLFKLGMTPEAVDLLSKEELVALVLAQMEQIRVLTEQNAALTARVAEFEARLNVPPKTPGNSSLPPSKGEKANRAGKRRSHAKDGLELLASSPRPLTMCAKCLPILARLRKGANSRRSAGRACL